MSTFIRSATSALITFSLIYAGLVLLDPVARGPRELIGGVLIAIAGMIPNGARNE